MPEPAELFFQGVQKPLAHAITADCPRGHTSSRLWCPLTHGGVASKDTLNPGPGALVGLGLFQVDNDDFFLHQLSAVFLCYYCDDLYG